MGIIYSIRNTVNNKIYIGKTTNKIKRWSAHKLALTAGTHDNSYLQRSWNKYGPNAFVFSVVCEAPESCLITNEAYHIALNDSMSPKGFNLADPLGQVVSDETKEKMRASATGNTNRRGKKCNAEQLERLSIAHKHQRNRLGAKHSAETIAKMSIAKQGKVLSQAHKDKLKQAWLIRKAKKSEIT